MLLDESLDIPLSNKMKTHLTDMWQNRQHCLHYTCPHSELIRQATRWCYYVVNQARYELPKLATKWCSKQLIPGLAGECLLY